MGIPHDWFFKVLMDYPELADEIIRLVLPWWIARRLAADPLAPQDGSFVGSDMQQSHSDRLFLGRFKDGSECLIYILLEHKSTPDKRVPVQLDGYRAAIWKRYERLEGPGKPLPVIIPIVVYSGPEPWTAPRSIFDRIAIPRGLGKFVRSKDYLLVNLSEIDTEGLKASPDARLGLGVMKLRSYKRRTAEHLKPVLALLDRTSKESLFQDSMKYIVTLSNQGDGLAALEEAIRSQHLDRVESEMASIAAQYIAAGEKLGRAEGEKLGREEGEKLGRTAGKSEVLLRLLQRRFGDVPEAAADRVRGASETNLDRWADAIIEAQTLEDVFTGRRLH